jgi:hypothetical protein
VNINIPGGNVQLYQKGIVLQPNTNYRLTFAAYSNNGRDMSLYLHKHGDPYTNYGLNNRLVDLTTGWQEFTIDFKTKNLTGMNDGRLRFWFAPYDAAGTVYHIDRVVLRPVGSGGTPDPDPEPPVIPPQGHCSPPVDGNLILNPGFESDKTKWSYYTDGAGTFSIASTLPYECAKNARIAIQTQGSNVQLYQTGFTLKPNTTYRLRLAARSNGGENASLFVHRHSAPYTNYGLEGVVLDLKSDWQVFVVEFTTVSLSSSTNDTRLRLWLAPFDKNGSVFEFDDVVLIEKPESLPTGNLEADQAETRLSKPGQVGKPANTYLIDGYFIDDDKPGRKGGGFVGGPGSSNECRTPRANLSQIWPDNGKMRLINIVNIGSPKNIRIISVAQDEPVGSAPDAVIRNNKQVELCAERDGTLDGRVYTITFEATYKNNTACVNTVYVGVPLANNGIDALDNGDHFNSLVADKP